VLLKLVGEEGLWEILNRGNASAHACGYFKRKLAPKKIHRR
jgi:hypothetical protein